MNCLRYTSQFQNELDGSWKLGHIPAVQSAIRFSIAAVSFNLRLIFLPEEKFEERKK